MRTYKKKYNKTGYHVSGQRHGGQRRAGVHGARQQGGDGGVFFAERVILGDRRRGGQGARVGPDERSAEEGAPGVLGGREGELLP